MVSLQIKILTVPVYVSQEAETLAVHSLFTMQNTEAIKKEFKECVKRRVFAQRVTCDMLLHMTCCYI